MRLVAIPLVDLSKKFTRSSPFRRFGTRSDLYACVKRSKSLRVVCRDPAREDRETVANSTRDGLDPPPEVGSAAGGKGRSFDRPQNGATLYWLGGGCGGRRPGGSGALAAASPVGSEPRGLDVCRHPEDRQPREASPPRGRGRASTVRHDSHVPDAAVRLDPLRAGGFRAPGSSRPRDPGPRFPRPVVSGDLPPVGLPGQSGRAAPRSSPASGPSTRTLVAQIGPAPGYELPHRHGTSVIVK